MRVIPAAVAAAALLAGVTCSFPDDSSDEVYVVIETPAFVVLDGDEMTVRAHAYRTIGGTPDTGTVDDVELGNADFVWYTSSTSIARVEKEVEGYATVTGVNPGFADITARAVSFEGAYDAILPLRVSGFLEIDSVTPAAVKWGEKVTLWGVGVQFAFAVDLGGQNLIPDTLTYTESGGLSNMQFWVPQPARTDQLFVIGPGVFFSTPDTVTVDTLDLHEPNDTAPALVNLDGAGPYPTKIPNLLYFNPALAFEELPRGASTAYDWYRFARTDTAQPLTLILRPEGLADSTGLFLVFSDSIEWNSTFGFHTPGPDPTWYITSEGGWYCPRGGFFPFIQTSDSMVLALKTRPRYVPGNNGFHILAFYGQRFNYSLVAVQGYLTSDPRLQADRFEENDICDMADDPAKLIAVAPLLPFRDSTLNIDNPHDLDFLRFRVTAPLVTDSTMIRIRSLPFGGGPGLGDRSDIDLYVLRVSDFLLMGSVADVGSRDSFRLMLPSDDYYLAVVDFAGEATRYSVCITVRFACLPPANPASGSVAAAAAALQGPARTRFRTTVPGNTLPDGRVLAVPAGSPINPTRSPLRRP